MILPEKHLKLELVTNLHILVRIDLLGPGSFVDLAWALRKFKGLQKLYVGFVFVIRAYMRRDNADRWRTSSALDGLVCRVMRDTPTNIEIFWGVWNELRAQMLENESSFRNLGFLDGGMLEKMARVYEPLRGRNLPY